MQIVITEAWAKATNKATDKASRTFDVVENSHNVVGRKGFDTFYEVDAGGYKWTVAHARVEEVIA